MLYLAICDDNERDRAGLRELLSQLPGLRRATDAHMAEYQSGESLLADVEEGYGQFDLLFLDIYMGGISGVETARRLRGAGCQAPIVFLTTSPNFGVESYEVDAAGYLLKPAAPEKLAALLEKILAPGAGRRVMLLCGRERRYFEPGEILYAESFAHTTNLHLRSGEVAVCGEKLSDLEELLSDDRFLRCHQSFLVNLEHVTGVREEFTLDSGDHIPVPVRKRREMADAYYRFYVAKAVNRGPGKEVSYV